MIYIASSSPKIQRRFATGQLSRRCVLHRSHSNPINFGEDWSNRNELTTDLDDETFDCRSAKCLCICRFMVHNKLFFNIQFVSVCVCFLENVCVSALLFYLSKISIYVLDIFRT